MYDVYIIIGNVISTAIANMHFKPSDSSMPIIVVIKIISEHKLHIINENDHVLVGLTFFISLHRILNSFFEI